MMNERYFFIFCVGKRKFFFVSNHRGNFYDTHRDNLLKRAQKTDWKNFQ